MYCPAPSVKGKCRTLLLREEDDFTCPRCGWVGVFEATQRPIITTVHRARVIDTLTHTVSGTLPIAKVICDNCGHNEAEYDTRQTRSADEPTTRLYTCLNCGDTWKD